MFLKFIEAPSGTNTRTCPNPSKTVRRPSDIQIRPGTRHPVADNRNSKEREAEASAMARKPPSPGEKETIGSGTRCTWTTARSKSPRAQGILLRQRRKPRAGRRMARHPRDADVHVRDQFSQPVYDDQRRRRRRNLRDPYFPRPGRQPFSLQGRNDVRYEYDAENRLKRVRPNIPSEGDTKVEFLYDYLDRRVKKSVFKRGLAAWNAKPEYEKLYVYDGYNAIEEITNTYEDGEIVETTSRYYVCGLDLSGTMDGAGGIGASSRLLTPGPPPCIIISTAQRQHNPAAL